MTYESILNREMFYSYETTLNQIYKQLSFNNQIRMTMISEVPSYDE